MKKYAVHIILAVVIIILAVVIGYNYFNKQDSTVSSNSVETSEPVVTATPEPTEAPHEHVYTETVTTEVTCETNGLKAFTCECGDTYTEAIIAMGHVFGEYIYNGDATYFADGTSTARCKYCEATDTGTAPLTKLKYTFKDMDTTMYAQQTVNARNMPCVEGEKIGSLSTNEEVYVTGQCIETGWYEIEYDGYRGYVANNYLSTEKVVTQQETTSNSSNSTYISDRCGYKVGKVYPFDAYEIKYLGEDRWYDEWNKTYYTAIANDNGGFTLRTDEYLSRVYAKEGETPVSERLGYKVGDYITYQSLGYTFNRIYEGNDIWYDDNMPESKMRAFINANGKIGFENAD